MFVVLMVLAAVLSSFLSTSRQARDNQIISRVNETARTLLDFIAFDVRMAGSGMPLGQSAFSLTDGSLGDTPLPILLTSDTENIQLRLNERGFDSVLSADYLPGPTNLTFSAFVTTDLENGDVIYLSDRPEGGNNGLQAVVTGLGSNSVTIRSDYATAPGSLFRAGSTLNRVSTVTYRSPSNWSGVTRQSSDDGVGSVVLNPNTRFTVSYQDASGSTLPLPLTAAVVADNLSSLLLTVRARADRPLTSGVIYEAAASAQVSIRNLILSR